MTELSFLIDLILNHKLPKVTKDAVAARIKEIETAQPQKVIAHAALEPRIIATSSRDVAQRHPDLVPPPAPVAIVAQTPAAAAAMASREAAIAASLSGKVDKVSGRPRKF